MTYIFSQVIHSKQKIKEIQADTNSNWGYAPRGLLYAQKVWSFKAQLTL